MANKMYGVYARKETKKYWGWISLYSERQCFSTNETNKKLAVSYVHKQYKEKLKNPAYIIGTKFRNQITIRDIIDKYVAVYKDSTKKNSNAVEGILKRHPQRLLGKKRSTDLTNDIILNYISKRRKEGAAEGSVKLELAYLRAALRKGSKMSKDRITDIFSLDGVDSISPNENQHQFTHEQYLKFVGVCPPWLALMVKIAYVYPVRAKELRNLAFNKIDIDKRIIRLEKTKNNSFRNLPLRGELFDAVKAWCREAQDENGNYTRNLVFVNRDGKKILKPTFYQLYKRCAIRCGLYKEGDPERLTYHRLRATSAADLNRAGVPLRTIMAIGGWNSIKTVQRYIGQAEQRDLDFAADRIQDFKKLAN